MNDVEQYRPAPAPGRVGQGTAVEQSRAVAEVQAAVVVAQQVPRSIQNAVQQMRESCAQMGLAERASYRFPRGGQTVSGPSVYLARELARVWGNIQYGLVELRRDDEHGQSEMQAWAWDVQTNSRNSNTFIVPHIRDRKAESGGPQRLVDMRDIYENNTNQASRRVREAIFNVLPPWFVEDAKARCAQTLKNGGGVPLPKRVADALAAFGALGVTGGQMEAKIGRPSDQWNEYDVAQLTTIYRSLQLNEVTIADEFPPVRTTAADIIGTVQDSAAGATSEPGPTPTEAVDAPPAGDSSPPADPPPEDARGTATEDAPASRPQVTMLQSMFTALGYGADERAKRLEVAGVIVGIDVPSFSDLRKGEASTLIETLGQCKTRHDVELLLAAIRKGAGA